MNRWIGKVAVVTGASSGIGASIAVHLINSGVKVIGLARRRERIDALKADIINDEYRSNLHSFKCDISNENDIKKAFEWINENFDGIDILVNNAGASYYMNLLDENNTEKLKSVINTNILGTALCTREAFHSMKKRSVAGHIIIINSIDGHHVPYFVGTVIPSFNIHSSTKHALTAMTEVLRQEFEMFKTNIKITSISPSLVKTEASETIENIDDIPHLKVEDLAQAVLYVLGTPPHVQVHELTIKSVGEQI